MRIGTWNMAGRWDGRHLGLVNAADCDVWLFTEVHERVEVQGFERHLSAGVMAPKRRWAGVYSRLPITAWADPHVASAAAAVDGTAYCSSILPWRSCGGPPTWPGDRHVGKTATAVEQLLRQLPRDGLVWGGDWNHALSGAEYAGSKGGRAYIAAAVERLGLKVPTANLLHQIEGLLSIDHIAVASNREVVEARRLPAKGLSDHDCYTVEVSD